MIQDTYKTKVIFRAFKDGEVLAIFPEIPWNSDISSCMSYLHTGQHGSASELITDTTRLASEGEYAPLKRELEQIGYNLEVHKKIHHTYRATRIAELKRLQVS